MTTPQQRVAWIRERLPKEGLFAEKVWRMSPQAFRLSPRHSTVIEKLGLALYRFNQACNLLYRQSLIGSQPAWIAELLEQGKPANIVELSRSEALKNMIPRVIRPDLILTEDSFALCELDSVPGGIGLT